MEVKRAKSQTGTTYRIMNDGNPILGIDIYTIEYRLDKYLYSNNSEIWDVEPSSPITTSRKVIEEMFNRLINI